jgi:hypothetical protein
MTALEIVENLYKASRSKDYDSFRALCTKDIEWIQNRGFPKGGHHHGTDAVIKNVFQQFEKDWNIFKFEKEELFESKDGARVTVIGSYIGEHKQTGKTVIAAAAHIFETENGKVKRFRQFTDTATIATALPA